MSPTLGMDESTTSQPPLPATVPEPPAAIEVDRLDFFYDDFQALHGVDLRIPAHKVTAFIGPSGCGKSTLLRCFNRMNDLVVGARIGEGQIRIHGTDIHGPNVDPIELRKGVGMVFQKSNPFPKSIYENVVYGLRIQGRAKRPELDEVVERSLRQAPSPVASSNASALPGPSPSSPKSC